MILLRARRQQEREGTGSAVQGSRAAAARWEASRGRLTLPAGSRAPLQREGLVRHIKTRRRGAQRIASHLPGKEKLGVI